MPRLSFPLARFSVTGTVVTAADVGVYAALRCAGARPVVADVPALAAASALSWAAHRAVTFRGDPYRRWLDDTRGFARAAVAGAAVDVLVVAVLDRHRGSPVRAKLPAVAVAGVARWILHRRRLFGIVSADHTLDVARPAPPGERRVSVVLPAYREETGIGRAVAAVRAATDGIDGGVEIVVVDDGSDDGTAAAARAAGADQVIVHQVNRGKGAAVRTGVLASRGRTVVFTDADLAYPPDQLPGIVKVVEEGWDVVTGSRRHDATATLVRARRVREIGGRGINWLTRAVLLGQYRDTQCGLKAFRSDAARFVFGRSRIDRFAFDVEVFVIAERNGLALTEVPVEVRNSNRSSVRVVRDAGRLVRDLFRIRRWAREGHYQVERTAEVG